MTLKSIIVGNKKWLGTVLNKPLSQSLQKQTQGKDHSFNKTLSVLIPLLDSIWIRIDNVLLKEISFSCIVFVKTETVVYF